MNTMQIYLDIPTQDIGLLQELSAKMGWNIIDERKSQHSRSVKNNVDKLYGVISLPTDYDYKEMLAKVLTEKYL